MSTEITFRLRDKHTSHQLMVETVKSNDFAEALDSFRKKIPENLARNSNAVLTHTFSGKIYTSDIPNFKPEDM